MWPKAWWQCVDCGEISRILCASQSMYVWLHLQACLLSVSFHSSLLRSLSSWPNKHFPNIKILLTNHITKTVPILNLLIWPLIVSLSVFARTSDGCLFQIHLESKILYEIILFYCLHFGFIDCSCFLIIFWPPPLFPPCLWVCMLGFFPLWSGKNNLEEERFTLVQFQKFSSWSRKTP